jgi:hypothetical protein
MCPDVLVFDACCQCNLGKRPQCGSHPAVTSCYDPQSIPFGKLQGFLLIPDIFSLHGSIELFGSRLENLGFKYWSNSIGRAFFG